MSSESTASLMKQFVAAILAYSPEPLTGGSTIADLTSSRVYIGRPPDGVLFPNIVVRLAAFRTDPDYSNRRATGTLECLVYARPRSKAEEAEEIADRLVQLLSQYRAVSRAIVFGAGVLRQSVPAFSDPADKEVVAVRVVADFVCWPALLIGTIPS